MRIWSRICSFFGFLYDFIWYGFLLILGYFIFTDYPNLRKLIILVFIFIVGWNLIAILPGLIAYGIEEKKTDRGVVSKIGHKLVYWSVFFGTIFLLMSILRYFV